MVELHRRVMAPILYPASSRVLRSVVLRAVAQAHRVFYAAAGDDELTFEMRRAGHEVVANDIIEGRLPPRWRLEAAGIEVVIGDVLELGGVRADATVIKNALHHMPSEAAVDRLLLVARSIAPLAVILEMEAPTTRGNWLGRAFNAYYRHCLHDDGQLFMTIDGLVNHLVRSGPRLVVARQLLTAKGLFNCVVAHYGAVG